MARPQQAAPRPGDAADLRALLHPTHYAVLGVPENALAHAIERAWQARSAADVQAETAPPAPLHPSLALPGVPDGPALQAAALRLAHAVLSDPDRRAVYDDWLARERAGARQRARWWRQPVTRVAFTAVLVLALLALAWWASR